MLGEDWNSEEDIDSEVLTLITALPPRFVISLLFFISQILTYPHIPLIPLVLIFTLLSLLSLRLHLLLWKG
jgi:hypothetical protein